MFYLFYLDGEKNIPTYFSSFLLLTSAFLLAYIVGYKRQILDKDRFYWLLLAILFTLLSLDEYVGVHERFMGLIRKVVNISWFYFAWVMPGTIIVITLGIIFLKFLRNLPVNTRNQFMLSGIIYVGGALGVEMIGGHYYYHGISSFGYSLITTMEESFEMIGIIYFIYALLNYIKMHVRQRIMVEI